MNINGFERISDDIVHRLVCAVNGLEGTGKSHFALTAPSPIAYFNFDVGLEGMGHKFADKEIWVKNYLQMYDRMKLSTSNEIDIANTYQDVWQQVKSDYNEVMADASIKTVVFDTGSEMYEICRLAYHGKLEKVMPRDYGTVNAEMSALWNRIYDTDKNLVIINKLKTKYVNDKATDLYKASGYPDTAYIVQAVVEMNVEDGEFGFIVQKCRHNPKFVGYEFRDAHDEDGDLVCDECNFPTLASTVIGGELEDWL